MLKAMTFEWRMMAKPLSEIMKDWTPDLVITDLSMPNMDGLELAGGFRTNVTGSDDCALG